MNNNKVYVKIGRKYQDAFQSICALVNHGYIDRSIVQSCHDDRYIETEQYIFEYTGDAAAIDTGEQLGMLPSGATWFRGFRGAETDNVMGTWHNLIELVSTNYHKEFSLVEYVQKTALRDEAETTAYKQLIRKVTDGLQLPVSKILPAAQDESLEDIYAVSLRLELFSGVGEPRPLLCKVYFRRTQNTFVPVVTEDALTIDTYVTNLISKRDKNESNLGDSTETEIVDNVLNSISKLIAGDMSVDFAQSVLVTNPTDRKTLEDFAENESTDDVRLECKRLKVLNISHILWYDKAFIVYIDDKKAFRAKIGLNDSLTLSCCCSDENNKLIEKNVITCVSPSTGLISSICLNTQREDLGLTEQDLEMIHKESAFADHFFPISCSELVRRHIDCTRYRCKCNTIKFDVGGKVRYKCADCPYPEVVYRYPDGKTGYTPLLSFDTKTLSVVEAETDTCRFCGRRYARENMNAEFLCSFCESALTAAKNNAVTREHKKNYKMYSKMIPLSSRVGSMFAKKYCFENADRLIFIVGNKKYLFDKLDLTDNGRIPKPEKRH